MVTRMFHLRIGQIVFPGGTDVPPDSRKVIVQSYPAGDGATTSLTGKDLLLTTTTWSFRFNDPQDIYITIVIAEQQSNGSLTEISRLALPFTWFTVNTVVRSAFPMLTRTPEKGYPMAYLDVHISDTGALPFSAPLGPLLVTPAWIVPEGHSGFYNDRATLAPIAPMQPNGGISQTYAYNTTANPNQQQQQQQHQDPTRNTSIDNSIPVFT